MRESARGRSLWRHRDFMLLWSGQTISETGSAVTQVALPLVAVLMLRPNAFEIGLLNSDKRVAPAPRPRGRKLRAEITEGMGFVIR